MRPPKRKYFVQSVMRGKTPHEKGMTEKMSITDEEGETAYKGIRKHTIDVKRRAFSVSMAQYWCSYKHRLR